MIELDLLKTQRLFQVPISREYICGHTTWLRTILGRTTRINICETRVISSRLLSVVATLAVCVNGSHIFRHCMIELDLLKTQRLFQVPISREYICGHTTWLRTILGRTTRINICDLWTWNISDLWSRYKSNLLHRHVVARIVSRHTCVDRNSRSLNRVTLYCWNGLYYRLSG